MHDSNYIQFKGLLAVLTGIYLGLFVCYTWVIKASYLGRFSYILVNPYFSTTSDAGAYGFLLI